MSVMPSEHLVLFENDGTIWFIDAGDLNRVDGAVSAYLDTGRDSLVHMTGIDKSELTIMASQISGWKYQTLETLQTQREQQAELEELMGAKHPWEES